MPTAKKFYSTSMFQNSKEFTQLGTLAKENRTSEYYQPEIPPQPKALLDMNDLSYLNPVQQPHNYPVGAKLRQEN